MSQVIKYQRSVSAIPQRGYCSERALLWAVEESPISLLRFR